MIDDLFFFILCSYGLTHIIVWSNILDKIRPDHKFFKCSFCVGFWVGVILYFLNTFTELFTFDYHLLNMFLMGFLSSGTSYILDNLIKEN